MVVKWEEVDQLGGLGDLHRAKVLGGWLVRQVIDDEGNDEDGKTYKFAVSITFYPDPNHEWDSSSVA